MSPLVEIGLTDLPKQGPIHQSGFLSYGIVGRKLDNNFVGFWEKLCLHKSISVFTDL